MYPCITTFMTANLMASSAFQRGVGKEHTRGSDDYFGLPFVEKHEYVEVFC